MLWLCIRFPQLAIELRQPRELGRFAVAESRGPRRVIIACNEGARLAGIKAGMTVPQALVRDPELRLLDRAKSEERRALHALADWALQFSSEICADPMRWCVWIEIGASLRYFGGLPALGSRLQQGLRDLDYSAAFGAAPTLEAAALLTWHAGIRPTMQSEDIATQLSPLSLTSLALDERVIEHLHLTGLRTIGEVLALPRASLARRFGPETTDYLQRLLGEQSDVRLRHRAAETYHRRYEFIEPIALLEGLLFPLRRMLQEFEGYLRGRDVAVQRLDLMLTHQDSLASAVVLYTSTPVRNSARLFALLREKLERAPWRSAVTEVALKAREFQAPAVLQEDFFDDLAQRSAGWSALLDKLRARLGDQSVKSLDVRDEHRPENAWCIQTDNSRGEIDKFGPDRPLWLVIPTAIPRPTNLIGRPERIEAGWWSGVDATRDYYLAINDEGARWWVYRDIGSDNWFLHGLWA